MKKIPIPPWFNNQVVKRIKNPKFRNIEIERAPGNPDIEIPPVKYKYPFLYAMGIGDSVVLPLDINVPAVRCYISSWGKLHNMKFSCNLSEKGVIVRRVK